MILVFVDRKPGIVNRQSCCFAPLAMTSSIGNHPDHRESGSPKLETQNPNPETLNSKLITHSVRNDFTGFASAALIAWKLTVIIVIANAIAPASTKTCQLIATR